MRTTFRVFLALVFFGCVSSAAWAVPIELNFEEFDDLESVTSQIPGMTLSNAVVLSSGISLNEFEFPPVSGSNVLSDDGGGIRIDFADPISGFGGYFTYLVPLTMTAFDPFGNVLAVASSLFSANLALSGVVGSSPNELLGILATNIAYVTITGDPAGGSFVVDNATVTPLASAQIPEPGTLMLLGSGLALLAARSRRRAVDK